jgi:hypothetical protein
MINQMPQRIGEDLIAPSARALVVHQRSDYVFRVARTRFRALMPFEGCAPANAAQSSLKLREDRGLVEGGADTDFG